MTSTTISNVSSFARTGLTRLALIGLYWLCLVLSGENLYASNATWSANPATSDWNTASNWVQGVVPTGTATFAVSNTTDVSLSLALTGITKIIFSSGASGFDIS